MAMHIRTISDLRRAVRADSLGYGVAYLTQDAAWLCEQCVSAERRLILEAIRDGYDEQWRVVACQSFADWDDNERCAHCDREIGPNDCEGDANDNA